MTQLAEVVDEARYVKFDPAEEVLYVWKGRDTVNVYGVAGQEVDAFMLERYSSTWNPTLEQAMSAIESRMGEPNGR
jgi:hypothetical protein